VKGRGSDRWWERRWWLWWGDMHRMRWTRRTVNRMRLTEWRTEHTTILSLRCFNPLQDGLGNTAPYIHAVTRHSQNIVETCMWAKCFQISAISKLTRQLSLRAIAVRVWRPTSNQPYAISYWLLVVTMDVLLTTARYLRV